jgi:hypothetical protein
VKTDTGYDACTWSDLADNKMIDICVEGGPVQILDKTKIFQRMLTTDTHLIAL